MRGGVILIIVALFVGYLGVTGKYKCFTQMVSCLGGSGEPCECNKTASASNDTRGGFPQIAPLAPIEPLRGVFG